MIDKKQSTYFMKDFQRFENLFFKKKKERKKKKIKDDNNEIDGHSEKWENLRKSLEKG